MREVKNYKDLVEKTDVREFKLMDGSTILSEVIEEDDDGLLLADAIQLSFDYEHGVVMHPWFLGTESRFQTVDWDRVVAYANVAHHIKLSYMHHRMKEKVKQEDPNSDFYLDLNVTNDNSVH